VFLAAVPLAFAAIPGSADWHPGWSYVVGHIIWFGSFAVAVLIGRDSLLPDPAHVWLYQKGVPLGEHALIDWLLDALLGLVILWWWVAALAVVAPFKGAAHGPADILGAAAAISAVFLTAQVVLGAAAGWGSSRGLELLIAGTLLSLSEPILAAMLPAGAARVLHYVAPPFIDVIALREAAQSATFRDALHPLIHILSFWGVLLGSAIWRLDRWRPR
jgi:hypothetical protein